MVAVKGQQLQEQVTERSAKQDALSHRIAQGHERFQQLREAEEELQRELLALRRPCPKTGAKEAADPELSVRTCFPRLWHNEQRFGSVFLGAALSTVLAYRRRSWMALDLLERFMVVHVLLQLSQLRSYLVGSNRAWGIAGAMTLCLCKKQRIHVRAVSDESNEHSAAVRNWLLKLIIGKNFCPWAKSVDDDGGIRVVTSLSSTEDGVLEDLQLEAEMLPTADVPRGVASTTLVVCPYVNAWSDFTAFNDFYGRVLENRVLFEEELGIKLVGFHPAFVHSPLYGSVLEAGDQLTLPSPEGDLMATVIDPDADADQESFRVQLENGEEQVISYERLAEWLQAEADEADESEGEEDEEEDEELNQIESMAQRAPRPTFHLLRLSDVSRALSDASAGDTDPLLQRVAAGGRCYSFRAGLSTLVGALEEPKRNWLEPTESGKPRVQLRDGFQLEADCVIASIQPTALGQLLKRSGLDFAVSEQSLSELLLSIHNKSVAVVNLCYEKNVLKEGARGFCTVAV
eukprot:g1097.t1